MEELKTKIKVMAEQQRTLKNQRKTKNIVGPRTMEVWQACYTHQSHRSDLRKLYMEYGILRGKQPEQIDINYKEVFSDEFINQLKQKYVDTEALRSNS